MSEQSEVVKDLQKVMDKQTDDIKKLWDEIENMIIEAEIYLSEIDNQIYVKMGNQKENITDSIKSLVFEQILNDNDISKIEIENEDGIIAELLVDRK